MHDAATATSLRMRWVGRENEIDKLLSFLGPPNAPVPPLFVSGPPSSGKTCVVKDLFKTFELKHAYVDCVECSTPRAVCENNWCDKKLKQILDQLFDHVPSSENKYSSIVNCHDLSQLVVFLSSRSPLRPKILPATPDVSASVSDTTPTVREITAEAAAEAQRRKAEDEEGWGETEYIILDNCERLRAQKGLLPALLRLDELAGRNLCTILVSNVIRDGFDHIFCTRPVLSVAFPPYTSAELEMIVRGDPTDDPAAHRELLALSLNVLGAHTLDLSSLRRLLRHLSLRAREPLVREAITNGEQARLYRLLRADLRQGTAGAWGLSVSSATSEQAGSSVDAVSAGHSAAPMVDVELPSYSKHLLVAAFLASFSPPSRDLATFSLATVGPVRRKKRGGIRKIGPGRKGAKRDADPLLEAPSVFGLERWLAIFYTLVIDRVEPDVEILSQIGGLVELGLVRRVGGDGVRDSRYACQAGFPMVKAVGNDLKLDLGKFIYYD